MRCLCAAVRRAGRLLTRRYEEALRPAGLTVSQFELMMTLRAAGPIDQGALARLMECDQTTLSRNLKPLLAWRWIDEAKDERDARRRTYRISSLGASVLAEAMRFWRRVHTEMERALGGSMAEVLPVLDRVMGVARVGVKEADPLRG
jgi:DNA-binding MarR family transcriptional regulator